MAVSTSTKTIDDINVAGKRVFVRVDHNVPMSPDGITDPTRIVASLPTLKKLLEQEPRVTILASHMGRPKGKPDTALSLAPVASKVAELLGREVTFLDSDIMGDDIAARVDEAAPGTIFMLENLRFYPGEKKNDPAFAKALARLADVYVNDAFGTCHRAHASMYGLPELLEEKVAGYLVARELTMLKGHLDSPEQPLVAIVGGAKVTDKIAVLERLLQKAQTVLIGGAMAYPFLRVQGVAIGKSRCSDEDLEPAKRILDDAEKSGVKLLLPVDHVVAEEFAAEAPTSSTEDASIPANTLAIDIGPKTREAYAAALASAKTVFWNGPMGVYEFDSGSQGTRFIAQTLAGLDAMTIIGGGDSVAAVNDEGLADKMGHVSTGGGASLELLEGKTLPGIEILN